MSVSHWHPLSALVDEQLGSWASPSMLRLPLAAGEPVVLRCVGDHMWPTVRHGQVVRVEPVRGELRPGDVVAVTLDGAVELRRVDGMREGVLLVGGDAMAGPPLELPAAAVLGIVAVGGSSPGSRRRVWRRLRLDLAEAWRQTAYRDSGSVRDKYEDQSSSYVKLSENPLPTEWLAAIARHVRAAGRVLVVGSGAGRETLALAAEGYDCLGIDFSPGMVAQAERLRERAGLENAAFRVDDVCSVELEACAYHGVLFTPDVYSFVSGRERRVETLRRLRLALAADGRVLLSARVSRGAWPAGVLALQWVRSRGRAEFGDTHTRYAGPDGVLRRSFVHCFRPRALAREIHSAGFAVSAVESAFTALEPRERGPA